jgi:hypothetical protein
VKYHYSYYLRKLTDSIKYYFFSRQKWLWKKLKGSWKDFDSIAEITILEGIKFYCEQDLTLENLNWKMPKDFPPHQKKFTKELRYIYKLITVNLPKLEKELEIAWDKVPETDWSSLNKGKLAYKEKYGEVDLAEAKINALKDKICHWAISNRRSIWY